MEEKKKRWRPSLTAYRALENEVSELKEQLALCKHGKLSEEVKELRHRNETLDSSNKYLETSRDGLLKENKNLLKKNEELSFENKRLKERGFWARVFNK